MSNRVALAPVVRVRTMTYDGLKRFLDLMVSTALLILLAPLFLIIAYFIRRGSPGCIFYRQVRVGRGNRLFRIYKFRTMVENAEFAGPQITSNDDDRVTSVGRWLRNTKLDELPQLINVVRGEMSLVGPRPQVPRFVNQFPDEYRDAVLAVRPGITGPTQLAFRHEEHMLEGKDDREGYYIEKLLPIKCEMDASYVGKCSLVYDLMILAKTGAIFVRGNLLRLLYGVHGRPDPHAVVTCLPKEVEEKVDALT